MRVSKLRQRLAVVSEEEREFNENRKMAHPPIHRKDSPVSQYGETPLLKEVPFGQEDRTKKQILDDDNKAFRKHLTSGGVLGSKPEGKIKPRKPNQKERRRIIQAKKQKIAGVNLPKTERERFDDTRKYIIKRREEGKPEISKKENTALNKYVKDNKRISKLRQRVGIIRKADDDKPFSWI